MSGGRAPVLVACLGNVFRGDDAFGVRVWRELKGRPAKAGVVVRDFGIRGLDFAYALLEAWNAVVIVDAAPRGREPGTLSLLAVEPGELPDGPAELDSHGMDPLKALRWARAMGAALPPVRIVACEPAVLGGDDDIIDGLSPAVEAAVPAAVEMVERACMSSA